MGAWVDEKKWARPMRAHRSPKVHTKTLQDSTAQDTAGGDLKEAVPRGGCLASDVLNGAGPREVVLLEIACKKQGPDSLFWKRQVFVRRGFSWVGAGLLAGAGVHGFLTICFLFSFVSEILFMFAFPRGRGNLFGCRTEI